MKKKNKISGRNIFQLAGDEKTNPYCEVNLNSIQLNDWNSLIESKQRKLRFAYSEIGRIAKKLLPRPLMVYCN